jgi:hypothetical protein
MRILITGHPKAGKTKLADQLAFTHTRHTDDLIENHEWSELSEAVSYWFNDPGPWIIEGVAIPRALRKWRKRHFEGKALPFDLFIYLTREPLTPMAKGIDTVMVELWKWIVDSGITILTNSPKGAFGAKDD